jgi:hypothetical protein
MLGFAYDGLNLIMVFFRRDFHEKVLYSVPEKQKEKDVHDDQDEIAKA